MIKKSIIIVIIFALVWECSKNRTLLLSQNNIEITSFGGIVEIAVSANTEWEVRNDTEWLDVETDRNMGNGTITIKVPPHYSTIERNALISVVSLFDGMIKNIGITQKGDHPFRLYDREELPLILNFGLDGTAFSAWNPSTILDMQSSLDCVSLPGSSLKFYGEVIDGIVTINFPEDQIESAFTYESFDDGFTMLQVRIEFLNDIYRRSIGLHKLGKRQHYYSRDMHSVCIFYLRDDFPPFKSGWNYVECITNYNLLSEGQSEWIGIISQDINVFIENGYRWKFDASWL